MSNSKVPPEKQSEKQPTRIVFAADTMIAESMGEPWRKWNVKPDISSWWMQSDLSQDPERDIGRRIAYCRAQMDNLSVEALARYTRYFDRDGISRTTIVRYESRDNIPGCRELRILADTLNVPVRWLLLGEMGSDGPTVGDADIRFLESLREWVRGESGKDVPPIIAGMAERQRKANEAQRQKWIDEARRPPAKD